MSLPTRRLRPLWVFSLLVSLTSCGISLRRDSGTPEMRQAIQRVVNDYLVHVVEGDPRKLQNDVLWADYLASKGGVTSKQQILQQVVTAKAIKPHPLRDIAIVEIDVDDNDAKVVLRRDNPPPLPEFYVKLSWIGHGWLVVGDSLFGPGGLLVKWPHES